jgi:N-acetylneuraminic acid mutarotase
MDSNGKDKMKYPRQGHSVCAIGSKFLVVTGSRMDHEESGKKCEIYNVDMDLWWEIADLNVARHYHSSCSFADKFVYIFCGINNATKKYLNTIERYENGAPNAKWDLIDPSTKLPVRQGCGVAVTGNSSILIFGGYSARMLKDAYLFNTNTREVTPLTKQPVIEIFSYQMPTIFDSKS